MCYIREFTNHLTVLSCSLSKVAYKTGDKAFVNVEIMNNSAVDIRNFVLKVRTTVVSKCIMVNFLTGNKSNKTARKGSFKK